ncbi:hypothetical protein ANO11243_070610 [Dothideomycetidae sp. 11243]|nr:hypothetical protein ANO11243_070610 [fungal sp. No.11243]
MVGQDVVATRYTPPKYSFPSASSDAAADAGSSAEWFLVDSTPASCSQIGLHHLFPPTGPRGKVDLVVSGPNYGRNSSAAFALSSGTLGAALEAAVAGHRAIALSFAFLDRENKPDVVAGACRHARRVVENLAASSWGMNEGLGLAYGPNNAPDAANPAAVVYTVNVPLVPGVEEAPTLWTHMLQNRWASSCFVERGPPTAGGEMPDLAEQELRSHEGPGDQTPRDVEVQDQSSSDQGERHFKWSPKFTDVYQSVERAGPGTDGWTVSRGQTSVTMLQANFMHVPGRSGELKL